MQAVETQVINKKGFAINHYNDERSESNIKQESLCLQNLSLRNFANQKIQYSQKNSQNGIQKLKKQEQKQWHCLSDADHKGWYCSYTDNGFQETVNEQNQQIPENFQCAYTVLTVHGCPGDHREWQRWEQSMPKNFVRWINFIVPGFDGADERRGSYKGTLSDIIELIFLLLRDGLRSQNKVVLLGHSMGSYICYAFAQRYSSYVAGIGLIAGATINWYEGMKVFHEALVELFVSHYNELPPLLQQISGTGIEAAQVRTRLCALYDTHRQTHRIKQKGLGELQLPRMNEFEIMASFKLFGGSFLAATPLLSLESNKSWNQVFCTINRQLPQNILKFMVAGKQDIVIEAVMAEKTFYHYLFGKGAYNKSQGDQIAKLLLSQSLKQNAFFAELSAVTWDLENIQTNFLYFFEDSGHTVHNRRGVELSKPFEYYLKFLMLLEGLSAAL